MCSIQIGMQYNGNIQITHSTIQSNQLIKLNDLILYHTPGTSTRFFNSQSEFKSEYEYDDDDVDDF